MLWYDWAGKSSSRAMGMNSYYYSTTSRRWIHSFQTPAPLNALNVGTVSVDSIKKKKKKERAMTADFIVSGLMQNDEQV